MRDIKTTNVGQAGHLKKHIHIVHEGHKDYKCESCDKSFSEAGSLKKHIHTIHQGHKDYKCESCGKSFSLAENLKRHIHTKHRKNHWFNSCKLFFGHVLEKSFCRN